MSADREPYYVGIWGWRNDELLWEWALTFPLTADDAANLENWVMSETVQAKEKEDWIHGSLMIRESVSKGDGMMHCERLRSSRRNESVVTLPEEPQDPVQKLLWGDVCRVKGAGRAGGGIEGVSLWPYRGFTTGDCIDYRHYRIEGQPKGRSDSASGRSEATDVSSRYRCCCWSRPAACRTDIEGIGFSRIC